MASGVKDPCSVPYVSTKSDNGFATPIAYDSCTSARLLRPLFTTDFAICRQMYAAERSTFVGSFPENAPPPYVAMMILRPVSPASPWGPPMMNLPDGLMWRWVCSPYSVSAGLPFFSNVSCRVFFTTCSTINLFISSIDGAVISFPLYPGHSSERFAVPGAACCVEITTVCTLSGSTDPSEFCLYSTVTCVLPSGRNHQRLPSLRTSVSFLPRLVATRCVSGMQTSVSSLAWPNMIPWSPAPTSISSLPTCTPPAMSGLCLLMQTFTSCDQQLRPLDSTDERSSTKES